ncbi:helix-turn-helix domain-containing protein [Streptomyces sp. NPDC002057]|uniref:helix-turn-helix domain-containing protein n=1 Tax=Streptomyces sp. NPDC002057 TaxID=3154664 RepID=UPI0033333BAA
MSTRSPRPSASVPPQARCTSDEERAARCTAALREMSEDGVLLADSLLGSSTSGTAPATEQLRDAIAVRDLAEEMISTLVVRQRAERKPLDELAQILDLSVDRLRKKYSPETVDSRLATRSRPRYTITETSKATEPPDAPTRLRQPGQRLASALHLAYRGSTTVRSQRELADRMGVDPSYVSRVFSGERDPSWPHVKAICELCGGDEKLMESLWGAATSWKPRQTDDPAGDLRTYLSALRYAAGSPDDDTILASAMTSPALTLNDLTQAFHGPGTPSWHVISILTVILHSLPQITLPLWSRAHATPTTCTAPAESF